MRILFVHNYHQKFGGDDNIVSHYIELFRSHGHHIELYQRHNDEILKFSLIQKARFLLDVIFSLKTKKEVSKLIATFQPDMLFVHGVYPLISPSVYDVARRCKVPIVQMVHDMRMWCPSAWFFREGKICTLCAEGRFSHALRYRCYRRSWLLSALYALSIYLARKRGFFKKVRLFIIPSGHIRDYLLKSGVSVDRIVLHPHIVSVPVLENTLEKPQERYIAFLGRLSPEKGLMLLMVAAEQLPHISFRIGGTGPMENDLKAYVENHSLINVHFSGFLSGADKEGFLREATLLVAPSECYESFGQVVVEANAVGTPVIAANHGGLASLVKDGKTGWLFPPSNFEGFIKVIDNAWKCPTLDGISRNALYYYETKLAEDKLIMDLEHSLEGVVK